MGRLSRGFNSGAFMFVNDAVHIAPLRFVPPKSDHVHKLYSAFTDAYESRSSAPVFLNHEATKSAPQFLLPVDSKNEWEVKIGKKAYNVVNIVSNKVRSVTCFTILGESRVAAMFQSTEAPGTFELPPI